MLHMAAFSSSLKQSTNDNSELRYEDAFHWTVLVMAPGVFRFYIPNKKAWNEASHLQLRAIDKGHTATLF